MGPCARRVTFLLSSIGLLSGASSIDFAIAQPTCGAAVAHGVTGCVEQRVRLVTTSSSDKSYIISAPIQADPARLYWACCALDAAGKQADQMQRRSYLVVVSGQRKDGDTKLDSCSQPILNGSSNLSEDMRTLWLNNGGQLAFVGTVDQIAIDPDGLCSIPPNRDVNAQEVGSVLLMSVPAANIPNKD